MKIIRSYLVKPEIKDLTDCVQELSDVLRDIIRKREDDAIEIQSISDQITTGGGGGVTDHGALTGLSNDDHPQYHNDARGDARYALLSNAAHTAQGQVDFGFLTGQETNIATVTMAASWVTPTSIIICSPLATATDDHDPEDYALEGIKAYPTNIIDGVGFDVIVSANYATFGKYNIQAIGV